MKIFIYLEKTNKKFDALLNYMYYFTYNTLLYTYKRGYKMTQKEKDKLKLEALRTRLSIRQTAMSCERSLLSYIRTACVFVSLAFTYLKIASYDQFDFFVIVMFAIGFFFLFFGVVEYIIAKRKTKIIGRHVDREFLDVNDKFFDEDDE